MTLDCGSLKCYVPFFIVPLRLPPSCSYPDFPLCSGCDPSHRVRDQASLEENIGEGPYEFQAYRLSRFGKAGRLSPHSTIRALLFPPGLS